MFATPAHRHGGSASSGILASYLPLASIISLFSVYYVSNLGGIMGGSKLVHMWKPKKQVAIVNYRHHQSLLFTLATRGKVCWNGSCLCVSLCDTVCLCLCVSLYVSVCLCVTLCVSVYLCVIVWLCHRKLKVRPVDGGDLTSHT